MIFLELIRDRDVSKGLENRSRGIRFMFWLRGIDPATLYHYPIPFSRTAVWYLIGGVRMWRVVFPGKQINSVFIEHVRCSSSPEISVCLPQQFIKNIFFAPIQFFTSTIDLLEKKGHIMYIFTNIIAQKRKINIKYIYFLVRNILHVSCTCI